MIIKSIDTSKEYDWPYAWQKMCEGFVITSKVTLGNYKASESKTLLFQDQRISFWQDAEYILHKEMIGQWYVTEIKDV